MFGTWHLVSGDIWYLVPNRNLFCGCGWSNTGEFVFFKANRRGLIFWGTWDKILGSLQECPRSVPRASQEHPRSVHKRHKSFPGASWERLRTLQERPRSVPGAVYERLGQSIMDFSTELPQKHVFSFPYEPGERLGRPKNVQGILGGRFQERPGAFYASQECPKSISGASRSVPGASQEHPEDVHKPWFLVSAFRHMASGSWYLVPGGCNW